MVSHLETWQCHRGVSSNRHRCVATSRGDEASSRRHSCRYLTVGVVPKMLLSVDSASARHRLALTEGSGSLDALTTSWVLGRFTDSSGPPTKAGQTVMRSDGMETVLEVFKPSRQAGPAPTQRNATQRNAKQTLPVPRNERGCNVHILNTFITTCTKQCSTTPEQPHNHLRYYSAAQQLVFASAAPGMA
jgi:hypothetical protein